MKTINDVLNFLNNLEIDVFTTIEGIKDLIQVKEILTNIFQDDNSKKLESIMKNVREIEILYFAGDWGEIPDVVKILRKHNKILQIQTYD